jgi:hypothetical protein
VGFHDNIGITFPNAPRVSMLTDAADLAGGNHSLFISVHFEGDALPSAEVW